MGFQNREVESKWLIRGINNVEILNILVGMALSELKPIVRHGSSLDTYWPLVDGFTRVRERDGIRQITVKKKDRGTNLNRIEVDIDCISPTADIHEYMNNCFGASVGTVDKSYQVWQIQDEHETVCTYKVNTDASTFIKFNNDFYVLEFEAKTEERVKELEKLVLDFIGKSATIKVEQATKSLFELFIKD